ncbi:MAG: QueT transporter [Candidatus Bathyarchaeota archaeon BA1]|nr:MAG: QueT transporter [Candidatus Bathyarchaeota archaeon BA1]
MSEKERVWMIPAVIIAIIAIVIAVWGNYTFLTEKEWSWGAAFMGLGRTFWLGAGALFWIPATILFFMEISGYTIKSPFRLVRQRIRWDSIDIATAAMCAAVYGGGLAATGGLTIIPGFTWIRPANMLSPLFGMMFGIPGCIGCAVGNFIADSLAGYLGVGSIGGFVGNFVLSYVPYKLMKDHSMRSARSWFDYYLWGVLVGSVWCAIYISWWLDVAYPLIGLPIGFIWGFFCPFVIINNALMTAVVGEILAFVLYPLVKQWGLYWADRIEFLT